MTHEFAEVCMDPFVAKSPSTTVDEQYHAVTRHCAASVVVHVANAARALGVAHILVDTRQFPTNDCASKQSRQVYKHEKQHAESFKDVMAKRHGVLQCDKAAISSTSTMRFCEILSGIQLLRWSWCMSPEASSSSSSIVFDNNSSMMEFIGSVNALRQQPRQQQQRMRDDTHHALRPHRLAVIMADPRSP